MWWGLIKNSLLCGVLFLVSCKRAHENQPAILYLASSLLPLKSSIEALAKMPLELKFASSSAIVQQLSQGAPCDGVVVADDIWQKILIEKNVVNSDIKIFATNSLVIASTTKPLNSRFIFQTLRDSPEKIILADPSYVPLGRYSKMALEKLKLFEYFTGRLILAHSAQMAVMLLKEGAASWALLYRSDIDEKRIFLVAAIDQGLHEAIRYPFLTCRKGLPKHAQAIGKILFHPSFKQKLSELGFGLPDES